MGTENLLYKREYPITDKISVAIPTVGEVVDHEDEYFSILSLFTAMPIDYMVPLDDIGVDFTKINEYELFLILAGALKNYDTAITGLVVKDLDFRKFEMMPNLETASMILYDAEDDIMIDRVTHTKIAKILRKLHHIEPDRRKPGNEEARQYLLERARKKAERNKKRKVDSNLEQLIIAMVNTEQFKYGYEGARDLTIYQFNESVRQIQRKIEYDNLMRGVYAGTIDTSKINQKQFNWLTNS